MTTQDEYSRGYILAELLVGTKQLSVEELNQLEASPKWSRQRKLGFYTCIQGYKIEAMLREDV